MKWKTLGIYKIESNIYLLFFCGAHKDIECFAFLCTISPDVIVNWSVPPLKNWKNKLRKLIHIYYNFSTFVFVLTHTLIKPPHGKIHPHKHPQCTFRRFPISLSLNFPKLSMPHDLKCVCNDCGIFILYTLWYTCNLLVSDRGREQEQFKTQKIVSLLCLIKNFEQFLFNKILKFQF